MGIEKEALTLHDLFPPIPVTAWEEKIQADLKGADYEKKLIWKTIDGLKIKPYYTKKDTDQISYLEANPGSFPFTRSCFENNNKTANRQLIDIADPKAANEKALKGISMGIEAITFNVANIKTQEDLTTMLNGVDIEIIACHFIKSRNYIDFFNVFSTYVKTQQLKPEKIHGSLDFDPFSYFLMHNRYWTDKEKDIQQGVELLRLIRASKMQLKPLVINAQLFHQSGASLTDELSFALSAAAQYIDEYTEAGIPLKDVLSGIMFNIAIGSSYFMEIAKFRAFRYLWGAFIEAYDSELSANNPVFIHGISSLRNKSIYDSYVNMLRTTTEAMTGVIGGCNEFTALPFDINYRQPDTFSERIARNIINILRGESYFDKVIDPAGGSYYVESLTDAIVKSVWNGFIELEEKGGFLTAIDLVKEKIQKTSKERENLINSRKKIKVGINQYPDPAERMLDKLKPVVDLSSLSPLKTQRESFAFEALRMSYEDFIQKTNKEIRVYLLQIGNLAMRKARANFSANFFGCAGYKIIDAGGVKTVEEGVKKSFELKADIVVICSSDEEYETFGKEITSQLKSKDEKLKVIIAGYPKNLIEQLEESGVDEFIHMKSNALEVLERFHMHYHIIS